MVTLASAATRPRFGGTLRAQLKSGSPQGAVAEQLVGLSDSAQPVPMLAISWRHSPDFKRWEFQLRPGVRFHDGRPLTAAAAAASLNASGPKGASAEGETLVIRSEQAAPNMLFRLAYAPITAPGGQEPVGTGPFRPAEEGGRVVLTAHESYWGGRPYLDRIEIADDYSTRDQLLIALEAGKEDIVELGAAEARRASQNGRAWTARLPAELLAVQFLAEAAPQVREAIALSVDRTAMHNVLLQKQGAPAASLLPQWLSGYAFLFTAPRDLARARTHSSGAAPIGLYYSADDHMARSIAERIAVNAREAGLVVRPVTRMEQAAAKLIRARLEPPDPAQALAALAGQLAPGAAPAENAYAAERALLLENRILPLFHLPAIYGLGPRVRGWNPSPWGELRLESVWLAP